MQPLIVTDSFFSQLPAQVQAAAERYPSLQGDIEDRAETLLAAGPFSVTFNPGSAASGDPHDFYSEATYWWPSPEDPKRYVKRDGVLNPDRFKRHGDDLEELRNTAYLLAIAGYLCDRGDFLHRAVELLETWFVNPKTMMNPHLEYAKGVPYRSTGRCFGIIELVRLPLILHTVHLLQYTETSPDLIHRLQEWFGHLLTWLRTSKKGHDERDNGNNHSTWWAVHVALLSRLTGNSAGVEDAHRWFTDVFLSRFVAPDGRQPAEISRTRSLHYSIFQLNAVSILAKAFENAGEDLWEATGPDGQSIATAVEFVVPYLEQPDTWPYQEIGNEPAEPQLFLQLAAPRYGRPEWAELNDALFERQPPLAVIEPLGPLWLLPGFLET